MGWYLKKSFAFGPLRLNLSKSGLGSSIGVKGLRVSTGPKGEQIHAGREGVYYRASLNSPRRSSPSDPQSREPVVEAIDEDAASRPSAAQAVATSAGLHIGNRLLRWILGGLMRGR